MTLGDLTAGDLGKPVVFRDGGGTYEGLLAEVQHSRSGIRDIPQTLVVLRAGEWRHCKTHPSGTPCTTVPESP